MLEIGTDMPILIAMPNRGRPSFAAKVVSATIDLLASEGVDALNATTVAARAECTTGAIYSHWPTFNDLLIEVWSLHLWPAMRTSLDDLLDAAGPLGDREELDELVRAIGTPTRRTHAALGMMLACRRAPEWAGVVRSGMQEWLDAERGSRAGSRRIIFAATVWGAQLLASVCNVTSSDWSTVLREVAVAARPPALVAGRAPPLADPALAIPHGDIKARLVAAAADEIVEVGYARATAASIVGRADAGRASLYRRFDTLDQVLIAAIANSINARFDVDVEPLLHAWMGTDPGPDIARVIVRYLEPERSSWRHLRLEAHLVARREPTIAGALGSLLDGSKVMARAALGVADEPRAIHRHDTRAHLVQALYIGLAVVADGGGQDVDRNGAVSHMAMVINRLYAIEAAESLAPHAVPG